MEKKQILICCNRTMNIGGIEKVLTTLLKRFDTQRYHILLVIHDTNGPFYDELPKDAVDVFYTSSLPVEQYLKDDLKHLRFAKVLQGLWDRLLLRLDKDWYAKIKYTYRISRRGLVFPQHFDCAISYSCDYSDLSMVVEADADKRIAFVHGDATYHPRAARLNDKLVR
ncbi:MAG: hypothetical protein IIV61_07260, partial [Oscillospiraceae bacterium]|nr:hypothetical protein [Oscillospiraceae bacterium]